MAIFRVPARLTWPGSGSPGVNIWHVRTVDPTIPGVDLGGAAAELDAALLALKDWYTSVLYACCPSGTSVSLGESITREGGDDSYDRPVWTGALGQGSDFAPPALAIVVGWRTMSATRRGRGRTFIGPLRSSTLSADGTPTDAVLTTIRTANDALIDESAGVNGWAIGVYGQENQGQPEPKVLRDITGHRVRDTFAVLRSRRD